MDAEDARAPPASVGTFAERGEQILLGRRDEGGEVRGDACLQQRLARAAVAVGVGAEQVDAGETVHLQVDEAGRGDPAAVRPLEPVRG